MADEVANEWSGANVRRWLESRVVASRLDQVAAERAGWAQRDDCDKATAEEMVCTILQRNDSADDRKAFAGNLRELLERDEYPWRGVYDDARFERHVRSYVRRLVKMTKTNDGWGKLGRYQ